MDKKIYLNGFSLALLSVLFFASIICVAYIPQQNDFIWIITPYAIAFLAYLILVFSHISEKYFLPLLILATLIRVVLVFSFPNLSDDLYRFLWDANLVLEGKNPYVYLPSDIVSNENRALYEQLNSQEYYSPYPPLSQLVYVIAAYISAGKIHAFAIIIKIFTLIAEIGTIYFIIQILERLQLNKKRVLIYALNPLILVELMGNLHFESFMILFLLMTVHYLIKEKVYGSAISFVMSIISKLLPLMFTPFLLAYWGLKKAMKFSLATGVLLLVFLIPILISMFNGFFFSSVGLYFQKFEFNASIYYLLRELGFLLLGYNIIGGLGPALALICLIGILRTWYKNRNNVSQENIFLFLLFTISLYLCCATTVHPWYIALPLVFCLFTRYRFPVVWSGLIMLTYINYSFAEYKEVMIVVALEYLIVFAFFYYEHKQIINKKASLH